MQINKANFTKGKYDIFSIFNERFGLVTAGTPNAYNTMTIGWGMMGTIWGGPARGKQIVTVFVRENRFTNEFMLKDDRFTVCFFPEKYRGDLVTLGRISGRDVPDKISMTSLTPKMLDNAVGFEEAQLTFVCKKIYTHKFDRNEVPQDVLNTLYAKDESIHYMYMGEIEDVFGFIDA